VRSKLRGKSGRNGSAFAQESTSPRQFLEDMLSGVSGNLSCSRSITTDVRGDSGSKNGRTRRHRDDQATRSRSRNGAKSDRQRFYHANGRGILIGLKQMHRAALGAIFREDILVRKVGRRLRAQ